MKRWLRVPYGTAAQVAEWLGSAAPHDSKSKLVRALAARRGILERYRSWSARHRDWSRPLLWIHAASVGEGLMAQPVIERVRSALPRVQIAYTFFSPSAEPFAKTLDADFADYLPFDSAGGSRAALSALAPTALVFSKSDVWPMLVHEASQRRVRLALVSAAIPTDSRRVRGLGARLTRSAYAALDAVGAASPEDARQLLRAGARADHVRVTGDTRYDQAWSRAQSARHSAGIADSIPRDRPTVVAGSTWPSDEHELLPAWLQVRVSFPTARLVIAPHELNAAHIEHLVSWACSQHLSVAQITSGVCARPIDADIIVVNTMGVLADLYTIATVAYIGGGFHDAGLHSLVEPAVVRVPTIIGPHHTGSRDARLMLGAGGAIGIDDRATLTRALLRLLGDPAERGAMSEAMGDVVAGELGAGERSFEIVRELLGTV